MPQGPPAPLPESIILSSFSGIKNIVTPERLTGSDLEAAVNVDIDDAGQVHRRRGFKLKTAGNFHSVKTLGNKVYGVKDGVLGIIRPDYSFSSLGVSVGAAVCYTEVDDEVYFSSTTAGIISTAEAVRTWGATSGQGLWLSPVIMPTATLGAISGKLLGDPPHATVIEAYKGRIYLAAGKTLWATELFAYNYVDRTKNFMQFEDDITLLMAMGDGLYVGTTGGLYFLQGVFNEFKLSIVVMSATLPGSGVWVPTDLVHPQARNSPMPTGFAAVMMTEDGVIVGLDGGTVYNLTQGQTILPRAISVAALFKQDQGINSYVAAMDSAGGTTTNARIGDYIDAQIVRRAVNPLPTPLAISDFKNGVYSIGGVSKSLAEMWGAINAPASLVADVGVEMSFAGTGTSSAYATIEAASGLFDAAFDPALGFTAVLDVELTYSDADPDKDIDIYLSAEAGTGAPQGSGGISVPVAKAIISTPPNTSASTLNNSVHGRNKLAIKVSAAGSSVSLNGGAVATDATALNLASITRIYFDPYLYLVPSGATIRVRGITFFPPLDPTALPLLSAL